MTGDPALRDGARHVDRCCGELGPRIGRPTDALPWRGPFIEEAVVTGEGYGRLRAQKSVLKRISPGRARFNRSGVNHEGDDGHEEHISGSNPLQNLRSRRQRGWGKTYFDGL